MKRLIAALALATIFAQPAHAAAVKWEVLQQGSSLAFSGKQMGSSFKGEFKTFSADIVFSADDLENSKVEAIVDITSVTTGDKERDTNIVGKEWFDAEQFKTARFVSTAFRAGEKHGEYAVDGNLTIRNTTLPVTMPFNLIFGKGAPTTMSGQLVIDRSKFSLGTGDWADTSIIANEVTVTVTLNAQPAQ